jgi:hypothetical protein
MLSVGQAGQASGAKDFWSSPEFFWWSLALAGILLAGALAIACARRWRTCLMDTPNLPEQDLEHYRTLYEQGELSREEFERITGILAHPAPERESPSASQTQPPS